MKHLYKAYDAMTKNQQKFMGIHLLQDKAPLLGLKIQDGKDGIPGLKVSELLEFTKHLFESLNEETPREEHALTISHIDLALEAQAEIVIPIKKKPDGTNK